MLPLQSIVYLLCALTSLASAVLLFRAARGNAKRLLWASSVSFVGMAVNNVLLLFDSLTPAHYALEAPANIAALASVLVLLVGLIWEAT